MIQIMLFYKIFAFDVESATFIWYNTAREGIYRRWHSHFFCSGQKAKSRSRWSLTRDGEVKQLGKFKLNFCKIRVRHTIK